MAIYKNTVVQAMWIFKMKELDKNFVRNSCFIATRTDILDLLLCLSKCRYFYHTFLQKIYNGHSLRHFS